MKRIRVNKGKAVLVFKNNDYQRVLTEGKYWLNFGETATEYDMAYGFSSPVQFNILLKDNKLAELLTVLEVNDNEIAIIFRDGIFYAVYKAGKYAFWKGVVDYTFLKADLSKIEITENIPLNILQKPEVAQFVRSYSIGSYEKGLLYIDEKFEKELGTGSYYFWKNAIPVAVMKADLRQQQLEISGQEILTSDKAALRINFYVQYIVNDVIKALTENKDYEKQLYIIMQLALREFIGTLALDEILQKKESVNQYVISNVKEKVDKLGVEIKDSGIRDIILPGDVKEIMSQVLIAQKKAQANIITRREETASTRSLLNTAKLMEENEMLFKLKEMEYVEKIAEKINSISLSGGNQIVEQLKEIFSPKK